MPRFDEYKQAPAARSLGCEGRGGLLVRAALVTWDVF